VFIPKNLQNQIVMVKKMTNSACFLAGDLTHLRELLHPANDNVKTLFSLAHAYLEIGEKSLPHRLTKSSETYFILEGQGEISIDGQINKFGKNDTAFVPSNALQWVRNTGDGQLVFLCIVSPPWSPDEEEVL
jgi:mannose-6-phosphate isomerase-like protein (cupin superfamily)